MYDPFAIYDYYLDRQVADEMGFETVQDLYEEMQNDYERNRATYVGRTESADIRNARNTRQQIS